MDGKLCTILSGIAYNIAYLVSARLQCNQSIQPKYLKKEPGNFSNSYYHTVTIIYQPPL